MSINRWRLSVIVALSLAAAGCKNGAPTPEPTAVVSESKAQLKGDLSGATAAHYKGDVAGSLKGAVLLIDPLGRLLGVEQIALRTQNGKRFLDIRCSDGALHLEVVGDIAVNDQPGFLIGDVSED
jgi:hypothetical protein